MPNTVSRADTGLSPQGRYEMPDPTPMDPPIGYKKQPTMMERVRELIRSEQLAAAIRSQGAETFEEADDFDTGEDDDDPYSPYEEHFEPEVPDASLPPQVASALTPALAPEPSLPGGASPASGASPGAGATGSQPNTNTQTNRT